MAGGLFPLPSLLLAVLRVLGCTVDGILSTANDFAVIVPYKNPMR